MPFCTQCGAEVRPTDLFCGNCGSRQGTGSTTGSTTSGSTAGAASGFSAGASAGSSYSTAPPPRPAPNFVDGLDGRRASIFCYVPFVGFIAAIIVLASSRFRDDRDVRFHGFQGLYLFVLWLFVDWVFGPLTGHSDSTRALGHLMKFAVIGAWIFMIVKTSQNELFRLPLIGDLAEKSVSEQK